MEVNKKIELHDASWNKVEKQLSNILKDRLNCTEPVADDYRKDNVLTVTVTPEKEGGFCLWTVVENSTDFESEIEFISLVFKANGKLTLKFKEHEPKV